jgi:hypothetical protein
MSSDESPPPLALVPVDSNGHRWATAFAFAVFGAIAVRLAVLGREVFDAAGVFVPIREPDVLYHLKRVAAVAGGEPGLLWRDPSLNAPCDFLPPWPWAFDGALGLFVRVAGLLSPPAGVEDVFLWACAALLVFAVGSLIGLQRALGGLGLGGVAGLVGVVVATADPVLVGVAAFGRLDNQVADLGALVAVLWALTTGRHRRHPVGIAALCVACIAFSDVALLACILSAAAGVVASLGRSAGAPATFVVAVCGSAAAFLVIERVAGLTRSYSPLALPLAVCFGVAGAFVAARAFGRLRTWRAQLGALVPATLLALTAAHLAGGDHLVRFFTGGDAVVSTISEGRPGYVASAPWTLALLVMALPVALDALRRARPGRFEGWTLAALFVASVLLFLAQVKFRYLADVVAAVAVAALVERGLSGLRRGPHDILGGAGALVLGVVLVPVHHDLLPDAPTGETRAVHALAAALRAEAESTGVACAVAGLPDYGAALNLLGGGRVSASTFWGDACSAEMFGRTTAACGGDLAEALRLHLDDGFATLVVEISDAEAAGLRRSPLVPSVALRYDSTRHGEARTLLAFDLAANRDALTRMSTRRGEERPGRP